MGADKLLLPRLRTSLGVAGDVAHAGDSSSHSDGPLDVQASVLFHVMQTAASVADAICLAMPPDAKPSATLTSARQVGVPVQIERDHAHHLGPLQALQGAWANLDGYEYVYVIAGDLPGLTPRVLQACRDRLVTLAGVLPDCDGVSVVREGRLQPLLACYRFAAGRAWSVALAGERRLQKATDGLDLAGIDEQLQGWPRWWTKPIHTPTDYEEWLEWSRGGNGRETRSSG